MSTSERRRGGAASSHGHRAGSHHRHSHQQQQQPQHRHDAGRHDTGRPHGAASGGASNGDDGDKDGDAEAPTGMPALPPRAAVSSATASASVDPPDGGVPLMDKAKEAHGRPGDTAHQDDRSPAGGAGAGADRGGGQHHDQRLLSQREDRIAELEREMAVMEREFARQLDKLSQSESETATFWQSKHSALNQRFLRTDTELRLLRSEVDAREADREELRRGFDFLRRELQERNDEARQLRSQVRGLKEFVSTSTRTDGQASDEVFANGMARLGNGLQNWVIVNFRRAKFDLSEVDEATMAELSELVPTFEELASTSKVYLLQSIVSSILVDMVFNAYYVGMSDDQMSQFRKMEQLLLSFTGAEETVNQWRSSTLALIRHEAPQSLSEETAAFAERVVRRINRVLDTATRVPGPSRSSSSAPSSPPLGASSSSPAGSGANETRDSALRVLVNNAIDLARLLAVQKAVLRVHFPLVLPHQRTPFEPDTMEDIGGEDEESLATREISCVAFPGIIKRGDENGGHLQYRNVISKARVICSPED